MRSSGLLLWTLWIAAALVGCRGAGVSTPGAGASSPSDAPAGRSPVAYINGQPVQQSDLTQPLYEAAGGAVLTDLALGRMIADRLDRRGLSVTQQDVDHEQELVLTTLDAEDPEQAARLLEDLRDRRGLGEQRFQSLLRRNAGLRKLVRDEVEVGEVAVRRAFDQRYGRKYQPRLIVVPTLQAARRVRQRVTAGGEVFSDVATEASTDPSAVQGGLLSPISPVDPAYPQAVRDALVRLDPGRVSAVISLEQGYALLRLERKIKARAVEFDDVKDELRQRVRRRLERVRMQQLARSMLDDAEVTVLNPTLRRAWKKQDALGTADERR